MKEGDLSLLFYAVEHDNRPAVEALLKVKDLDVTQINPQGKNVMNVMAENDQVDMAKLFLEKLKGEEGDILKKFVNCQTRSLGEQGHMF